MPISKSETVGNKLYTHTHFLFKLVSSTLSFRANIDTIILINETKGSLERCEKRLLNNRERALKKNLSLNGGVFIAIFCIIKFYNALSMEIALGKQFAAAFTWPALRNSTFDTFATLILLLLKLQLYSLAFSQRFRFLRRFSNDPGTSVQLLLWILAQITVISSRNEFFIVYVTRETYGALWDR